MEVYEVNPIRHQWGEFDCDSCGYSTIETKQESKWNGEMRDGYRIVPKKILGNTGNRKGRDAVARAEVEYCENRWPLYKDNYPTSEESEN